MELKKENLRNVAGGAIVFNKKTSIPFRSIAKFRILNSDDAKRVNNAIIVSTLGVRDANGKEILSLRDEEIEGVNGGRADALVGATSARLYSPIAIPVVIGDANGVESVFYFSRPVLGKLIRRAELKSVLAPRIVAEIENILKSDSDNSTSERKIVR